MLFSLQLTFALCQSWHGPKDDESVQKKKVIIEQKTESKCMSGTDKRSNLIATVLNTKFQNSDVIEIILLHFCFSMLEIWIWIIFDSENDVKLIQLFSSHSVVRPTSYFAENKYSGRRDCTHPNIYKLPEVINGNKYPFITIRNHKW